MFVTNASTTSIPVGCVIVKLCATLAFLNPRNVLSKSAVLANSKTMVLFDFTIPSVRRITVSSMISSSRKADYWKY